MSHPVSLPLRIPGALRGIQEPREPDLQNEIDVR